MVYEVRTWYARVSSWMSIVYVVVSVCPSVCLSVCPSVCASVCLPVCLPACLFGCFSVYFFVCLSACLSVCLSVCMSVRLSACLFACLPVYLSVCLSVLCLDITRYENRSTCRVLCAVRCVPCTILTSFIVFNVCCCSHSGHVGSGCLRQGGAGSSRHIRGRRCAGMRA